MTRVNIPRRINDIYRCYKMEVLEIRYQDSMTELVNLSIVVKDLGKLPAGVILKYFEFKLSSETMIKEGRYFIVGKFEIEQLLAILDEYIETFSLCPHCEIPEYKFKVRKDTRLLVPTCEACGRKNFEIDQSHPLCKFISCSIDPLSNLFYYLEESQPLDNQEFLNKLDLIQLEFNLNSLNTVKLAIIALGKNAENTIQLVNSNIQLINLISCIENGKIGLLVGLEEICNVDEKLLRSLQDILKILIKSKIINGVDISNWYKLNVKSENVIISCSQLVECLESGNDK